MRGRKSSRHFEIERREGRETGGRALIFSFISGDSSATLRAASSKPKFFSEDLVSGFGRHASLSVDGQLVRSVLNLQFALLR